MILAALLVCAAGVAHAQLPAAKLVADGHYMGARQQLERYLNKAEADDKYKEEAEALKLVCDYVLQENGTADRLEEWLQEHSASQYTSVLSALLRNQLLKDGRHFEALEEMFTAIERGDDLFSTEPLAYPLSALRGEVAAYSPVLYRMQGENLYKHGDYAQAIPWLEGGEKTRNSLYMLGMCYMNEDCCWEKAAESFSNSAGTEADGMAQNAWFHAGTCYLRAANKVGARTAFQQASSIGVNPVIREEALYNYALILHEGTSMGFGESVTVFERFLNEYPKSIHATQVSQYLTEVYFTTKSYSAALASINKIKRPTNEILTAKQRVLYNLGIQEFSESKYMNAVTYSAQAIELGKMDEEAFAESYFLKGESEYRVGDYRHAAEDLQNAVTIGAAKSKALKNNDYAWYSLGYAHFKQKNYNDALTAFSKVVDSNVPAQVKADAYNRMGDCHLDSRKYTLAFDCYQKAVNTDKLCGDYSLLQQAYIEGLRGNYDSKVALIDRMNAEYEGSEYASDALFEQGRAYVQKGDVKSAETVFNSIKEKYPQSANARKASNELAMLKAMAGKTDEAIMAYNKVIEDYPTTEEAQTALANLKDIYTSQGRLNEFMQLASKVGKTFSNEELDEMTNSAALKAMSNGNYVQAQQYYNQLYNQTISEDYRLEAQTGLLRSAYANKDYKTTIEVATEVMADANKLGPEVKLEARLYRADSHMKSGNTNSAVADLQVLTQDEQTVYGAQANVMLAQYAYDTKQYSSAEQVLNRFIDNGTSHTYWLARAFVLLSDVYTAQDRGVEARQTLLSLKSNYTENEEINKMIKERLK